jgi:hypothetical protein
MTRLSKVLPVLASLSVAALAAVDPAMAQTPGGWNGRGPFIWAGRVRPVYVAPLMNAAPPPYTTRPGFVGALPLVEAPPPPVAVLPPPLPVPVLPEPPPPEVCIVDPRDIGLAPFLNVRASPAGWPIAMIPNWTPVVITPDLVGPWIRIVAPLDGWVFRPYLYCPPPPPPMAYAPPPPAPPAPRTDSKSPLPPPAARGPRGRMTPNYGPFEREPD